MSINKSDLLAHYADAGQPKHYIQIDGWIDANDSLINPGNEHLSLTGAGTSELWRGDYPLRLHISPDASQEDVIGLLERAIEWVRNDWNGLQDLYQTYIEIEQRQDVPSPDEMPEWLQDDTPVNDRVISLNGGDDLDHARAALVAFRRTAVESIESVTSALNSTLEQVDSVLARGNRQEIIDYARKTGAGVPTPPGMPF